MAVLDDYQGVALTCADITVCGTASQSTPPAELTLALILGLVRHLVPEATAPGRAGPAFGMDVVAWSQHLTDERCGEVGVRRAGPWSS